MRSRMIFKLPVLAMIAAFGATMISGEAAAQQQQQENQPEQQQQCRAILSPSTLSAPSAEQPENEQRRQQRVAGEMTLQARLTEDIGNVTEVKIDENSNIKASLAKEEQMEGHEEEQQTEELQTEQQEQEQQQEEQRRQQRQTETEQAQNRVPVQVDVSEAEEGEWEVTFVGEGNKECKGTLRVRGSGPAR